VHGQGDLFGVVLALAARRGGADFLHCGDQQADEDGDDRDHHQQLDQREPMAFRSWHDGPSLRGNG
jgi:hypothetical protein